MAKNFTEVVVTPIRKEWVGEKKGRINFWWSPVLIKVEELMIF